MMHFVVLIVHCMVTDIQTQRRADRHRTTAYTALCICVARQNHWRIESLRQCWTLCRFLWWQVLAGYQCPVWPVAMCREPTV